MEGGKSAERVPLVCTGWMQSISPAVHPELRPAGQWCWVWCSPSSQALILQLLGCGRVGGSQAKVPLGLEGRGAPQAAALAINISTS